MPGHNGAAPPAGEIKYIVEDSPFKSSFVTLVSLVFTGFGLVLAVLRLASAHDLNGLRALLTSNETVSFLSAVATVVGPAAWIAYRTVRAWWKRQRDNDIVDSSPIAARKSEVLAEPAALPITRARETTMRVVDPNAPTYDGGRPRPTVVAGVDISRRDPWPMNGDMMFSPGFSMAETQARMSDPVVPQAISDALDAIPATPAPRIPGDALEMPSPKPRNSDAFNTMHRNWLAAGKNPDFPTYLEEAGWAYRDGRWNEPEGAN